MNAANIYSKISIMLQLWLLNFYCSNSFSWLMYYGKNGCKEVQHASNNRVVKWFHVGNNRGRRLPKSIKETRIWSSGGVLSSSSLSLPSSLEGLSKYHQRLMKTRRQRVVTGRYPLFLSVQNCPTRKWLGKVHQKQQLLVNGTIVERSVASFQRFHWLDEEDGVPKTAKNDHNDEVGTRLHPQVWTIELLAELSTRKPAYLHLDTTYNQLWSTDFSLTSLYGGITKFNLDNGLKMSIVDHNKQLKWPNEILPRTDSSSLSYISNTNPIYHKKNTNATTTNILVADGFLVPGKDQGGIYYITQKRTGMVEQEETVCLTPPTSDPWFYHRAVWIDLTGDGRQSILTARARRPPLIPNHNGHSTTNTVGNTAPAYSNDVYGQLVWLERPKPHHYDTITGTIPLNEDNTLFDPFSPQHIPWKMRVLDNGPDVMFNVVDMDTSDTSIEVIACQFFGKKLTIHSIDINANTLPKVIYRRIIDDRCGASYASTVAQFLPEEYERSESDDDHNSQQPQHVVIDCGSPITTILPGNTFSHILVTTHECKFIEDQPQQQLSEHHRGKNNNVGSYKSSSIQMGWETSNTDGGSLFAYQVPKSCWKTQEWKRSIIATGFKVRGQLGNMINPGAPGFVYTFYAQRPNLSLNHRSSTNYHQRPWIGISGDCAEAAYILRPRLTAAKTSKVDNNTVAEVTDFELLCEISCGATIGSLAIGYDNFCDLPQQQEFAKIYIPCYEKDKILVFALGDGTGP